MSILGDLQNIILPPLDTSSTQGIAILAGSFVGGAYLLSPYLGASDYLSMALVGWAVSRSVSKLFVAEALNSAFGVSTKGMIRSAVNASVPLGVMYYVAGMYPMVDLTSSLIVYGAYVAGAYATQKIAASISSS